MTFCLEGQVFDVLSKSQNWKVNFLTFGESQIRKVKFLTFDKEINSGRSNCGHSERRSNPEGQMFAVVGKSEIRKVKLMTFGKKVRSGMPFLTL